MQFRAALLSVVLLACGCTASGIAVDGAPPVAEQSSPDAALAAFFERQDEIELARSPLAKSFRGIVDADYGRWDDFSDAAAVRHHAEDMRLLAELRSRFGMAGLSAESRLSYRIFEAMMERRAKAFPYRHNELVFDQMNGLQSQLPALLINIHRIGSKSDAEAYVSRLDGIDGAIDSAIAEARRREARGVLPPKWVYPYLISDTRNLISGAPFDGGAPNALLADFTAKVDKLDLPQAEKDALVGRARQALVAAFKPAYGRLLAFFQEQQSRAGTDDGVWRFADGAAFYNERLGYYTTTDMTAAEVHQLGLDNVARIHGEMRRIMAAVGFKGALPEFFEHLRTSEQFYYPTREAYLADAEAKLAAMQAKLPQYFGRLPKAAFTIKPVEAFREKSAGKAFYQAPTPDGMRPGTYYVNLYNLRDMPRTELEALAYHEGLPGHHLQRALQVESGEVPPFRRFGGFTAYTEDWGLYTEELGKDMGFYQDPYSDFGRLGMELWRACRLVVDTGIHDKRWSREKAIQYLKDNTPNPDGDIEKAIERYIVYPGQATAYTVGKLKIMDLRGRARQRLGKRFDYRGFHDAVLSPGPVPLDVLDETVTAWIEAQRTDVGFIQSGAAPAE